MALTLGKWIQRNQKDLVYEIKKDGSVLCKNLGVYDHPDLQIARQCDWTVGTFSKTPQKLQDLTGKLKFNLKMDSGKEGVLAEDGKTILTVPYSGIGIETIQWISDSDFQTILDSRENWDQASTFHPIQPSKRSKIVFISGIPGAGKTTSAFKLAQMGYVYYEGDCFMHLLNPYIPLDVEDPTNQYVMQAPLKNYPEKAVKAVLTFYEILKKYQEPDEESSLAYYGELAKNVDHEWKRIGGENWVVGQAVSTRKCRDLIKQIIPDCVFVSLRVSPEVQLQRLERRMGHLQEDQKEGIMSLLVKTINTFEPVGQDEERAVDVLISSDLNENEVLDKILEAIKMFE